jgi:hypothetical protein
MKLLAASLTFVAVGCATSPSSSGAAWPNEPQGLSVLTDQPWTELSSDGWARRDSANDRSIADATAPLSGPGVLEIAYPEGFAGGTAPATEYYPLNGAREVFVGLWWKASEGWQPHSSAINKIQFIYLTGSSDVAMVMHGADAGRYRLQVLPQWREHDGEWLTSNVHMPVIAPGRWHRIEWHLRYETAPGAADGIIRWWFDGALAGDHRRVRYPGDAGFSEYQISPTWGGVGDVKQRADYYRIDHTYISAPRPPRGMQAAWCFLVNCG